jgi:hypothetical protein
VGETTDAGPGTASNQTPTTAKLQKMFPSYAKLIKKRTRKLETWVNTTKQTVHYLLNVNNQADDDPNNDTQSDSSNNTDTTHPTQQGLPTPTGSEASQVPPNITA